MNIENTLLLMKEYNISAEEVFFLQLLFLSVQSSEGDRLHNQQEKPCNDFCFFCGADKIKQMLQHLKSVKIINSTYKIPESGEPFIPSEIDFNKIFEKRWLKYSGDLGYELWEKYPDWIYINGANYTLKNISRSFKDMDEFFYTYGRNVQFNPQVHEEAMRALEWAKENNVVKNGIVEFVISKQWETFKHMQKDGFDGNTLNTDEIL